MVTTVSLVISLVLLCSNSPEGLDYEISSGASFAHQERRLQVRDLISQLSAADPATRAKGACALRELGDEAAPAIDALVALLADGAPVDRSVCERNWGRWNSDHTTTPGEQAASALVAIGGHTLKPLHAALKHSSWIARRNAAWALGALDDGGAAPLLIGALKDAEAGVRKQAAWALGAIDEPRAVDRLMQALKDADPGVREQSAWALGAIGDGRAIDALLPMLQDPYPGVRRQAAWAIGVLNR